MQWNQFGEGKEDNMIKIENEEVIGWEHAIRGMRNPMNSWDKSDSHICKQDGSFCMDCINSGKSIGYCLGENDLDLMKRLRKAGTDHRKFMRMIVVYADITAPLYWWKEADTYKVGTVRNSCSTMHKITEKEFTLNDFSCEHLFTSDISEEGTPLGLMKNIIDMLNIYRTEYLNSKDKSDWWQLIQLLPSSYNQRATVMFNYEVLSNIYHSRKNHKLDCWIDFCKWIETLPYSELITGDKE